MEQVREAREKAQKYLYLADRMLTQTYPLVKDPKVLLVVLENIFLALTNGMAVLLHYERHYKRIPPFQDNFDSKFNMLKLRVADQYGIPKEHMELILNIKNKIQAHKKSPVEFSREGAFIICSKDYRVETIHVDMIKKYISTAKHFLHQVEEAVMVK